MHFGFAGEGFPLLSLPKTPSGIWFVRRGRIGASSGVMFAILHVLGSFACDLLKSRRRLQAENLFLRHQLNIALRQAPARLRLRGSDRALLMKESSSRKPPFLTNG